ncbi:cell division topological specificity factor MinE [Bradyrhizobium sp. RDT10]
MSMRLLRLFSGREPTAPVARERLQILLAHERGLLGQSDLLVTLREEILAVVSKHVQLDPDKVIVKLERGKTVSTLEVDIEVPNNFDKAKAAIERRMAG